MTVEVLCSNIKGTRNIFTPTALKDFSKGIVPYSIHFMISGRSKSPKLASIEQGRYTVCTQTWTLSVLNWRTKLTTPAKVGGIFLAPEIVTMFQTKVRTLFLEIHELSSNVRYVAGSLHLLRNYKRLYSTLIFRKKATQHLRWWCIVALCSRKCNSRWSVLVLVL